MHYIPGIYRDKTMADKSMYIPNNPSLDYKWWFKRLDTNLMNQPIKIQQKFPKMLSQWIRKRFKKNYGLVKYSVFLDKGERMR